MAFSAKLKIDGFEYDLTDFNYKISKPVKANGLVAGLPQGNTIHFSMLSPDDSNMVFHEWMFDKTQFKNGSLIFSSVKDAAISVKSVCFEHARCIALQEHFEKHSSYEMLMHVTILAETVKFGPEEEEAPVYSGEEEAPEQKAKVTDVYWTEEGDDTKHREVFPSHPVTLYLQTEDFVAGEQVEICFLAGEEKLFAGNKNEICASGNVDRDGTAVIPNFKIDYEHPKKENK